jgi:hypothetical protein
MAADFANPMERLWGSGKTECHLLIGLNYHGVWNYTGRVEESGSRNVDQPVRPMVNRGQTDAIAVSPCCQASKPTKNRILISKIKLLFSQ